MANQEQLEILKQGVEVWNKWRKDNPDATIDLCNADLTQVNLIDNLFPSDKFPLKSIADLSGADLSGADLSGADLSHADLSHANLSSADLSHAQIFSTKLSFANLSNADLSRARFGYNDLRFANLSSAKLLYASFSEADLSHANLSHAHIRDEERSFLIKSMKMGIVEDDSVNPRRKGRRYPSRAEDSIDEVDIITEPALASVHFDRADLSFADLSHVFLPEADFNQANLNDAEIREAILVNANLELAGLIQAKLPLTDLSGANLRYAFLDGANLSGANLSGANLEGARMQYTKLVHVNFVGAKLADADISNSEIYGVNVWDIEGECKEQDQLIITPDDTSVITVDNIKVVQFIYLILNNKAVRDVLNTLTSKTVLILGRFAPPERKVILDSLRNKLREYDLLPIVFDFERPDDKDFTETIKTLAGMCYFVIADVTNPKSSPLELQATVPDYQIPFVPIIQEGEMPFAMMVDLQKKYKWVLDTIEYKDGDQLIRILKKGIIDRAMQKHDELKLIKAQIPTVISASQFEE